MLQSLDCLRRCCSLQRRRRRRLCWQISRSCLSLETQLSARSRHCSKGHCLHEKRRRRLEGVLHPHYSLGSLWYSHCWGSWKHLLKWFLFQSCLPWTWVSAPELDPVPVHWQSCPTRTQFYKNGQVRMKVAILHAFNGVICTHCSSLVCALHACVLPFPKR